MHKLLQDEADMTTNTAILKALPEPNRLRIFATLMYGDSCNRELQESLGLAPNFLSHHLRTLEKAGLVNSRRDRVDGRWIYYSVDCIAQRIGRVGFRLSLILRA